MTERGIGREPMGWRERGFGITALTIMGLLARPHVPKAFVTPFGPLYLTHPQADMIAHEQCHMRHMREKGVARFYFDYIAGGGCAEEKSCGWTNHVVCSYPWGGKP